MTWTKTLSLSLILAYILLILARFVPGASTSFGHAFAPYLATFENIEVLPEFDCYPAWDSADVYEPLYQPAYCVGDDDAFRRVYVALSSDETQVSAIMLTLRDAQLGYLMAEFGRPDKIYPAGRNKYLFWFTGGFMIATVTRSSVVITPKDKVVERIYIARWHHGND